MAFFICLFKVMKPFYICNDFINELSLGTEYLEFLGYNMFALDVVCGSI